MTRLTPVSGSDYCCKPTAGMSYVNAQVYFETELGPQKPLINHDAIIWIVGKKVGADVDTDTNTDAITKEMTDRVMGHSGVNN